MALREIIKDNQGAPTGEYKTVAGGTLWADSPIGSRISWDNTKPIPIGYLLCDGSTFAQADYPELYAFLGSNTLPYEADHNKPSNYEITAMSAGTNNFTAQYDGELSIVNDQNSEGVRAVSAYINDVYIVGSRTGTSQNYRSSVTLSFKKGDVVRLELEKTANCSKKFYKECLIIKAKMVAMPSDFMDKVEEVVNGMFLVVNDAIDATGTLTANQDLRINMPDPPSGYKYFCCDFKGTGNNSVFPRAWASDAVYIHNTTNTSQSYDVTVNVTYIKV